MNTRMLALFLGLVLSCGTAATTGPVVKARTLKGDARLPAAELEAIVPAEQWKALGDLPYRAVVILRGKVDSLDRVTAGAVSLSEPDATWVEPARTLAKTVRLKATTVGTNILPDAEVFVIFYGAGQGRRALVYARQSDEAVGGWKSGDNSALSRSRQKYFGIEKY